MSASQEFVFARTYAQWLPSLGRRETWDEAVSRYFDFFVPRFQGKVPEHVWTTSRALVGEMHMVPSMRALWSAGPMLEANHMRAYNCCSLVFKDLQSPVELFYILLCGVGVGFSVESRYISKMPSVAFARDVAPVEHTVQDTMEGWATSLQVGLDAWFSGGDVRFDYSKVRARGVKVQELGGRTAGPESLKRLHLFVRQLLQGVQGRQLSSLEWLDVGNMIGDVVLVGGARRASQITFSDLSDEEMRHAKDFPFPSHRATSNNSAVYTERPSGIAFMREWAALAESGTGERGIFNLGAAMRASPRRKPSAHFRTNPCGEIILRADQGQFCNLSEVVVRPGDNLSSLLEKTRCAVWLGAMQSTLTEFPFIRPSFKAMCDEERLLGVSLTGQMDHPAILTPENLDQLKAAALQETEKACRALGIHMSAAVTTGKPSGTVSQVVDCASGAHPRYAPYYLRRYRIGATDPLFLTIKDSGIPYSAEVGQRREDVTKRREDWKEGSVDTWVLEFPERAPPGAVTRNQVSAVEQLEWYLRLRKHWCEHNQSMTVYVRDDEWPRVGEWVFSHFDDIIGLSFLPYEGGKYALPPYEEISAEDFERRVKAFPQVDFSRTGTFESDELGVRSYACSGDACELV